ncbi:MAG: tryptophan--tRNA ligase [Candidatus Micrarchaeales archaeon]|nr:tryptophan--tRNA ligase [Candidatus Micrarchaeales archaeon]
MKRGKGTETVGEGAASAAESNLGKLSEDNIKLVEQFGAGRLSDLAEVPDFYTFRNGLMFSHRDFDSFYEKLKRGDKCSIVSGFNASGTPHMGHVSVFDTNLFFQKQFGVQMFIPISDDESYVSLKVKTQEEGLRNSLFLARTIVAFGFDMSKTRLIIDQLYTNIYNLAIRLSRGLNRSEIKDVYGYTESNNIGIQFYPVVQAAHILLPQTYGIPNVLVPIGPDEDAHLRVCRGLAEKFGFQKPAVVHSVFMPGLDGNKMSKSRGNAIFFLDAEKEIKKAVMSAFSGGKTSVEEHRKHGGNPDIDVAFFYLKSYFLTPDESAALAADYRSGKVLSGEMKKMLLERVMARIDAFRQAYDKVTPKDLEKVILTNDEVDLASILEKHGVFSH